MSLLFCCSAPVVSDPPRLWIVQNQQATKADATAQARTRLLIHQHNKQFTNEDIPTLTYFTFFTNTMTIHKVHSTSVILLIISTWVSVWMCVCFIIFLCLMFTHSYIHSFLFYPVDQNTLIGHAHLYYYGNTLMIIV
jgi:hypothetical protein